MKNTNPRTISGLMTLLMLGNAVTMGTGPEELDVVETQMVTTTILAPAEAIIGAQSDGHRAACWGCIGVAIATVGTGFGGVVAIGCGYICGKLIKGGW